MRYLGMPLGAHYKDSSIWYPIIEKMEKRLSGWKRLYLEKGGKLTLLKSTLSSLPTYFLSLFIMSQAMAARIERIQRNSFGGSQRMFLNILQLLGIRSVCQLSVVVWGSGGLGCLTRHCLGSGCGVLGKKVIDYGIRLQQPAKYGEARGGWCTGGVRGSHGCGMWRSIKEGIEKFFSQILYNVGEGCCVSFWHDPWSGPIPSKELFSAMFACFLFKEAWVSNLVISNSEGSRKLEYTFSSWSSRLGGRHCLFLFFF